MVFGIWMMLNSIRHLTTLPTRSLVYLPLIGTKPKTGGKPPEPVGKPLGHPSPPQQPQIPVLQPSKVELPKVQLEYC